MGIKVFDFFSGCGGTSKGFEMAGCEPVFALDCDRDAAETYKLNFPGVIFQEKKIEDLDPEYLKTLIDRYEENPILFCGCAPCQPFTKQITNRRKNDQRTNLLSHFGLLVKRFLPHFVFVENVPGLQKLDSNQGPLPDFEELLDELGYHHQRKIIASQIMAYLKCVGEWCSLPIVIILSAFLNKPMDRKKRPTQQSEIGLVIQNYCLQ